MKKTKIIASLLIAALMVVTLAFAVHAEEGEADLLLGTAAAPTSEEEAPAEGEGDLLTTAAPDTAVSNDTDGAEAPEDGAADGENEVPENEVPENEDGADAAVLETAPAEDGAAPEADTGAPADDAAAPAEDTAKKTDNSWIIWLVIGVVAVAAIIFIAVKTGKKSK